MNKLRVLVRLIVLCASLPVAGLAATPQQLQQAYALLNAEQADQALAFLEAAYDPETASTQELFLLGASAKLSDKLKKSEQYYRAALAQEPSAGRIRLELAEVLYLQGKLDASRAELITVRDMNPPQQVRDNIDGFVAQVDAAIADPSLRPRPQKNWSAYVTAGLTSDSNVNAGPDTDTVTFFGLPFTLSATAQETRDLASFVRTGIEHQKELENGLIWKSSAGIAATNYAKSNAYDTTSLFASTGPSVRLSDTVKLSVPITYKIQRYNNQGSWHTQSLGVSPSVQVNARPNLQFYFDTSISKRRYRGDSARDLRAISFNPSLNYQPGANGNIAFGLQYGRENSGLDIYSNTTRGLYLGYQHVFRRKGIQASLTASYTDIRFDGVQAAFTDARHDKSTKLSANISYTVPRTFGLTLQGSVSFQINDSNQDINSYDRTQVTISLAKRF